MHAPPPAHPPAAWLPPWYWLFKSVDGADRSSNASDPPADDRDRARVPPPRRRRRWPWVLGAAVLASGAVAATAPYWLSSGVATRMLASMVNDRVVGRVAVGDLKLRWGGPTELQDAVVYDTSGRPVLRVAKAQWSAGLWKLMRSDPAQFGRIVLWSPRATAYVNDEGGLSIVEALRPRRPSASEGVPEFRGKIDVIDGALTYQPAQSPAYELTDIDGHGELVGLNDVGIQLSSSATGGGRINGDVSVRDLFATGEMNWRSAQGELTLSTDERFDLAAVSNSLAPAAGLAGRGELRVDAKVDAGRLRGQLTAQVHQLHAGGAAYAGVVNPIDLEISGDFEAEGNTMNGSVVMRGEPGQVSGGFTYQSDGTAGFDGSQIARALLTGELQDWAALTIRARGDVDVPLLAQAVPSLLQLRPGVQVSSGRLEVDALELRTRPAEGGPTATGALRLTDVRAERDGRTITLEPVTSAVDLSIAEGQGLSIRTAAIRSGFGELHASGDMRRMKVELDSNLEQFYAQFAQIWDTGLQELAGALSADIELTHDAAQGRMQANGRIWWRDLLAAQEERQLALRDGEAVFEARGIEREGRIETIELRRGELRADDEIAVTVHGSYTVPRGGFRAELSAEPLSWVYLSEQLINLGVSGLPEGLTGQVELTSEWERAARDQPIATNGRILARDVRRNGERLVPGESVLVWEGGRFMPAARSFDADVASFSSEPLRAKVRRLVYEHGGLSGELQADAELEALFDVLGPLQGWDEPPAVAGRLSYQGSTSARDLAWSLKGEGELRDAVFGRGASAIHDPRVRFALDIRGDTERQQLRIDNARVDSQLIGLHATGTVGDYTGRRELDLNCRYEADWAPVMSLIHSMAPGAAGVVAVRGRSADEFRLVGALSDPEADPAYRGLRAEPTIRWDAGELFGLHIGGGSLQPRLADARVTLPGSVIPASGGQLNLVGQVDLRPADPVLHIPGRHGILRNVQMDPQMSRELLSRLNPLFGDASRIEGSASLELADVILPLGPDKSRSAGSGRLTTSQLRVQPKEFLAALLEIGSRLESRVGGAGMVSVRLSDLNFTMDGGQIRYRDFTMYLMDNDLDVKFSGSVAFDGPVNLVASVPVRSGLLERFGVRAPVTQYVRALEGVRVDIPVVGDRLAPRLDLASVDLKPLLAQAAQRAVSEEARDTIGRILGEPTDSRRDPAGARPAPRSPTQEAEGLLRGLLGEDERRDGSQEQQRQRRR